MFFKFNRSDDNFCLLSHDKATTFVIELDDMRLSCKRYKPSKTYHDFHANQLKLGQNSTLPFDISLIKD